jgi:poly-gamma-glutamate capsule biosynthesis protein CapA/YwtB (metallophosphatase superfamily)
MMRKSRYARDLAQDTVARSPERQSQVAWRSLTAFLLVWSVAACAASGAAVHDGVRAAPSAEASPPADGPSAPSPEPSGSPPKPSPRGADRGASRNDARATATLAFAGDVHFEGVSARALTQSWGSAGHVLADADLAIVNLETAVTRRGTPAPKQYTFRAPDTAFDALRSAGVDAVTLANNHGMDYGLQGLRDTLATAAVHHMPLLGAGSTEQQAFAPLHRTVNGVRIAVLAATDVLDTFAQDDWVAGPAKPGLASSKDPDRLLAAVRAEAAQADAVVVYLHWGHELTVCPTARQRQLAALLARAGADLVVGSHAHVPQPGERVGRAYVDYGLGNFVFYASTPVTQRSGVLTVEVGTDGVQSTRWQPATIQDGLPVLDRGHAKAQALRMRAQPHC